MKVNKKLFFIILFATIIMIIFILPIYATTGTVTTDSLKLRQEASTSSNVLDLIDNGTIVDVSGEENNFYKVTYNGSTGYLSKDYVSVQEEQTNIDNNTEVNEKVKVSSNIDIKILPLINSITLGIASQNDTVTVISQAGNWSYIETDNILGWVVTSELKGTTVATTENVKETTTEPAEETTQTQTETTTYSETTKYVNSSSIYVRTEPNTTSSIATTLILNTDVKVIGESGDWYQVKYNEISGYIRKDLLSDTQVDTTSRGNIDRSETVSANNVETSQVTESNNTTAGTQIIEYAKQYLGCPYVYGASGSTSFDCSGFTMYVYKHFGYSLSHSATAQSKCGVAVDKSNLQAGDLVFFLDYETMDGIGHCGIYIGDGNFIHASSGSGYCVKISTLLTGSYNTRYVTARRII